MNDVVLYDGECGLCECSVQFILATDAKGRFRFAPLQGETARGMLRGQGIDPDRMDSVVLIENGRAYTHSTAALRIARHLRFPFSLLWTGMLIPPPVRDAVYDWISRHRHQLLGRPAICRLPTAAESTRFL